MKLRKLLKLVLATIQSDDGIMLRSEHEAILQAAPRKQYEGYQAQEIKLRNELWDVKAEKRALESDLHNERHLRRTENAAINAQAKRLMEQNLELGRLYRRKMNRFLSSTARRECMKRNIELGVEVARLTCEIFYLKQDAQENQAAKVGK